MELGDSETVLRWRGYRVLTVWRTSSSAELGDLQARSLLKGSPDYGPVHQNDLTTPSKIVRRPSSSTPLSVAPSSPAAFFARA